MDHLATAMRHLLATAPGTEAMDLSGWADQLRQLGGRWRDTAARALVGGFEAPCIAFAFAAGYQAALARLFGDHDAFRALCVTEREGNRPRHMQARLRKAAGGWRLDGEKTYVTGGTQATLLYVAARTDDADGDRPVIRVLTLPAERAGVRIEALPSASFVPELPHARLRLAGVIVDEAELLPGDGYNAWVKPFRTVEDTHVELALLGQMVRRTRDLTEVRPLLEQLFAQVATLFATATLAPDEPAAHLLLAGNRHALQPLLAQLETAWERAAPAFHVTWLRDRRLLGVAASAREVRTARAWESYAPPG